jgi:hypothetical protein
VVISRLSTRDWIGLLGGVGAILLWLVPASLSRVPNYVALRAAAAMQSALERNLVRGSRVQVLDADNGAFLAAGRAGMRQATPHIQWFSLLLSKESVRSDFLAALKADPPAGILLTNAQWPKRPGFEAADDWPAFAALLLRGDRDGNGRFHLVAILSPDALSFCSLVQRSSHLWAPHGASPPTISSNPTCRAAGGGADRADANLSDGQSRSWSAEPVLLVDGLFPRRARAVVRTTP